MKTKEEFLKYLLDNAGIKCFSEVCTLTPKECPFHIPSSKQNHRISAQICYCELKIKLRVETTNKFAPRLIRNELVRLKMEKIKEILK